jgi:hypothetical protein
MYNNGKIGKIKYWLNKLLECDYSISKLDIIGQFWNGCDEMKKVYYYLTNSMQILDLNHKDKLSWQMW